MKSAEKNDPAEPKEAEQLKVTEQVINAIKAIPNQVFYDTNIKIVRQQEQYDEMKKIGDKKNPPPEIFPVSTDVLLSLFLPQQIKPDEIVNDFSEYFNFQENNVCLDGTALDPALYKILKIRSSQIFPPETCLQLPIAVKMDGTRAGYKLKRLFIGDIVWLFFYERMGVFQILKALLRDYSYEGKYPIPLGDFTDPVQSQIAIILENMVREYKIGLNSSVKDRDSLYRQVLGWTSREGRRLGLQTFVNSEFNAQFHAFIRRALRYYRDKSIAVAIRGTVTPGAAEASVETLTSIAESIERLRQTFDRYNYNRNYNNTLSGIVWVLAALSLISHIKNKIGIPDNFTKPYQYIPAIYDLIVSDKEEMKSNANRYDAHKACAQAGRDILIEIEIDPNLTSNTKTGGYLDTWLGRMEEKIEKYRTEYKNLMKIDLKNADEQKIEQAA